MPVIGGVGFGVFGASRHTRERIGGSAVRGTESIPAVGFVIVRMIILACL